MSFLRNFIKAIAIPFVIINVAFPAEFDVDAVRRFGTSSKNVSPGSHRKRESAIRLKKLSDFKEIVRNGKYFVDKSLLIKELLELNEDGFASIITAPRQFGKSINLSMLKYFLKIETDPNGKPLTKAKYWQEPVNDTENYDLFTKSSLKIGNYSTIMQRYFGRHPVIQLDLGGSGDITSYEQAIAYIGAAVRRVFKQHRYLLLSEQLLEDEKLFFRKWIDNESYRKFDDYDITGRGLPYLCKYLSKHFGTGVFVLVDDYDSFVSQLRLPPKGDNRQRLMDLIVDSIVGSLTKTLKNDDEYVAGALISGVTLMMDTFDGLLEYGKTRSELAQFYGFTENDLSTLKFDSETADEVRSMYGGYRIGPQLLYNPGSLVKFLQTRKLEPYLVRLPKVSERIFISTGVKYQVERLVQGETISIVDGGRSITGTKLADFVDLVFDPSPNATVSDAKCDWLFSFLLTQGYLTEVAVPTSSRFLNKTFVRIPNEETRHMFIGELERYYVNVCKLNDTIIRNCEQALSKIYQSANDTTRLDQLLPEFRQSFAEIVSALFRDDARRSAIELNENGLHCLLFYLVYHSQCRERSNSSCCYIRSFRDDERPDIVSLKNEFAVIWKLKCNDNAESVLQKIIDRSHHELDGKRVVSHLMIGLNIDTDRVSLSYSLDNENRKIIE